jgi:hypothetical protein
LEISFGYNYIVNLVDASLMMHLSSKKKFGAHFTFSVVRSDTHTSESCEGEKILLHGNSQSRLKSVGVVSQFVKSTALPKFVIHVTVLDFVPLAYSLLQSVVLEIIHVV